MSIDYAAAVAKAAEFLDEYCENKEWRSKVDPDDLDIEDGFKCILGQIYGEYVTGTVVLRDSSSDSEFDRHNRAFNYNTHRAAWIEYLSNTEDLTGTEWIWRSVTTTDFIYTYKAKFLIDGKTYVVYASNEGDIGIRTEESFNEKLKRAPEKPKYVDGRIYLSASGLQIFIYDEAKERFIHVNHTPLLPNVSVVESTYGPLKEFTCNLKTYTVTNI